MAKRMPMMPNGKNVLDVAPPSDGMFHNESQLRSPEVKVITANTTKIPIDITETTIENLNEISEPAEFNATKIT
jgi:hypothetical protein